MSVVWHQTKTASLKSKNLNHQQYLHVLLVRFKAIALIVVVNVIWVVQKKPTSCSC